MVSMRASRKRHTGIRALLDHTNRTACQCAARRPVLDSTAIICGNPTEPSNETIAGNKSKCILPEGTYSTHDRTRRFPCARFPRSFDQSGLAKTCEPSLATDRIDTTELCVRQQRQRLPSLLACHYRQCSPFSPLQVVTCRGSLISRCSTNLWLALVWGVGFTPTARRGHVGHASCCQNARYNGVLG